MVKKPLILLLFVLTLFLTPQAFASEKSAGSSAKIAASQTNKARKDPRVLALEAIFRKYNSPLEKQSYYYVKYADQYGIDWRLLPAISGLESSFGIYLMPQSYNAYGWGGGYIYFKDWEEGIAVISKALKENYIDRGADTVYKIGPIYAEAKHWSGRVAYFMDQISNEYISTFSSSLAPTL